MKNKKKMNNKKAFLLNLNKLICFTYSFIFPYLFLLHIIFIFFPSLRSTYTPSYISLCILRIFHLNLVHAFRECRKLSIRSLTFIQSVSIDDASPFQFMINLV